MGTCGESGIANCRYLASMMFSFHMGFNSWYGSKNSGYIIPYLPSIKYILGERMPVSLLAFSFDVYRAKWNIIGLSSAILLSSFFSSVNNFPLMHD